MLTFVGLGLYDERSVSARGREAIRGADRVFAEFYTSRLAGAAVADLEAAFDVEIEVLDRSDVEEDPDPILEAARSGCVAFLVGGDPMISTTHVDLRLRAADRGIETRIVHGTSASAAAASLTGLQNYRFGKATTLPFPGNVGGDASVPESVLETIRANRGRGLHTLVFLDVDAEEDRYMSGSTAADHLAEPLENALGVVVARAGSDSPVVAADRLSALAEGDFGPPLHLLVVPGDLHPMEREAVEKLAGAPAEALDA